jgi:homopolymeric O-antigen transport system ATP-binding protein
VSDTDLIEVTDVRLAYQLARNRAGTAKEYLINLLKRQVVYDKLWALDGVSFQVGKGDVLGIIGPNGAGKSTLLKVIAGVLHPNDGRVIIRGNVAPMIEVSGGMNPELTGRENIVLLGTLLGRSPKDMRRRAEEIAEWAGLVHMLEVPIRAYSTGMKARLGFAINTDHQPEILLIDEVFAVGDEAFKKKSRDRIEGFIATGTSVILVSHALTTIEEMCDTVMWLEGGHVKEVGSPAHVVAAYRGST